MNIEIINIGTELLLGEIVNTNATYLQKMCKELGFNVFHQSVVGDNPKRIEECFEIAFQRGANCIITTGGLGPTNDDLTKELSAKYLGLDMVYNEEEAKKIFDKCSFLVGSNNVAEANFKQAYFPLNCYVLENEVGTANGCVMSKDEKMIINLPGPPKEMMYVVENELKPYLEQYREEKIYTYEYITMFIGESNLQEMLKELLDNQTDVSIALYASEETVRVRLATKAKNEKEAELKMKEMKKQVENIIGEYVLENGNIKDALMKIMVPYNVEYNCDFRLNDDFLDGKFKSNDPQIIIHMDSEVNEIGEILKVKINDEIMYIPTLKRAKYSYAKVQSRIIALLYKYLKGSQF